MPPACSSDSLGPQHPRAAVVPARAGLDPDPARRLPVPRRPRPGDLRRQGQEPAAPAVVVLPGHRRPPPAHRHDGHHGGQRRVDGGQHRGRGAAAGVLLDQGVRPALQREVPRRQVLPVARGHRRRRVPAGDGRARRQAQGHPLLRPLQPRLGDPRDRRRPAAGLPDALVQQRGLQALGADRPALPARLHRQVLGARASATVSAEEHREIVDDFCDFMAGHTRPFIAASSSEMYAASEALDFERAARLRDDLGAMHQALEKQAVVLGDGADADVIALAEDPLEVAVQIFYVRGGRIRGQRGWVADRVDRGRHRRAGGGLPAPALRRRRRRRRSRARSWCPSCRPTSTTFEQLLSDLRGSRVQIRVPQRGDKKTLQETVAAQRQAGRWRCTRPSGPAT